MTGVGVGCLAVVGWPFLVALRLFRPQTEADREIAALQYMRVSIGLLVGLTVWFRDGEFEFDLDAALMKIVYGLVFAVPIWVPVTLFLVVMSSGDRPGTCKRLAAGSGLPLAMVGLVALYYFQGDGIVGDTLRDASGGSWVLDIPLALVGLLLPLWGGLFALSAAFLGYKNMFNANDGHPLLPALLAPWFAIASTGYELAAPDGGEHSPLSIGLSVTGCLAIIGCSIYEYRFVAVRHNVSLKSGPPPREPATESGRFTWGSHPLAPPPPTWAPPPYPPTPPPLPVHNPWIGS
ncbi:hypothetical protein [Embleya sp. NBC_00896]|uniref:hypothetical protein n=1 Tax=Embleya sp. NBC_00896 TaxID=2975961 RepID=UPI00386D83D3|nr:hypothetical protein OG928_18090 [Embleya sp. NBC_00896]